MSIFVSCFICLAIGLSYFIHINCGGSEIRLGNGTTYDKDIQSGGPSNFIQGRNNWGISSTGDFLDNNLPSDTYLWNSSIISGNNIDLYRTARLSPLSLTYYGYCLANGNYTVNLHFAEIIFSGDRTYTSLGRRFFDIYIQGKLQKKDFDIETEAGGVNIPIVRAFTAVVNENTLEIRFIWAGKGTTSIPFRGVYGPLISGISMISDSPPPSDGNSLSAGAVAGIVIAVLFVIFFYSSYCMVESLSPMQGLHGKWVRLAPRNVHPQTNLSCYK